MVSRRETIKRSALACLCKAQDYHPLGDHARAKPLIKRFAVQIFNLKSMHAVKIEDFKCAWLFPITSSGWAWLFPEGKPWYFSPRGGDGKQSWKGFFLCEAKVRILLFSFRSLFPFFFCFYYVKTTTSMQARSTWLFPFGKPCFFKSFVLSFTT